MSQSQQRVPRSLHGLDLFEKKFKPIELTVDERFKMLMEGAAVPGLEFFQPLVPSLRLHDRHARPFAASGKIPP